MRVEVKVKGILGMADVTFGELAELSGTSRAMIHNYMNRTPDFEDTEKGLEVVAVVNKLSALVQDGKLPLNLKVPKAERVGAIRELLDNHAQ